eukprot:1257306-Amphidinium_carterae.1
MLSQETSISQKVTDCDVIIELSVTVLKEQQKDLSRSTRKPSSDSVNSGEPHTLMHSLIHGKSGGDAWCYSALSA